MEVYQVPIFQDISKDSVARMVECFRMRQVRYKPEEVVCVYDGAGGEVGVVLEGTARLVRIDRVGNRAILERLRQGAIFGEPLGFAAWEGDSISVVCEEDCLVLYIDYAHIMKQCENACQHHSQTAGAEPLYFGRRTDSPAEPAGGGAQPAIHPGEAAVLLHDPVPQLRQPQLHHSLYPQYAGRLHQHRPQCHDAGAAQAPGGGHCADGGEKSGAFAELGIKRIPLDF